MNETKIMQGKNLIFISRIGFTGESIVPVTKNMDCYNNSNFILTRLSIKNGTWIASGFFTYVVKIKE